MPMTADEVMNAYFSEVMEAFMRKARTYYQGGATEKERFLRLQDIKDAIKGIGTPDSFGIGAMSGYSSCPPDATCVGGACIPNGIKTVDDDDLGPVASGLGISVIEFLSH